MPCLVCMQVLAASTVELCEASGTLTCLQEQIVECPGPFEAVQLISSHSCCMCMRALIRLQHFVALSDVSCQVPQVIGL